MREQYNEHGDELVALASAKGKCDCSPDELKADKCKEDTFGVGENACVPAGGGNA